MSIWIGEQEFESLNDALMAAMPNDKIYLSGSDIIVTSNIELSTQGGSIMGIRGGTPIASISYDLHPGRYPRWKRIYLRIKYLFSRPKLSKGCFKKTQV